MYNILLNKIKNTSISINTASINGIIAKELFLIAIVIFSITITIQFNYANLTMAIIAGVIGFITVIAISFKPNLASVLAPLYAIAEGILLSSAIVLLESSFPGIAIQAVIITLIISIITAFAYMYKIIKVTNKFKQSIFTCLLAILGYYFMTIIFSINIHATWISVLINIIIAIVATLCLLMDYHQIEQAIDNNMSKEYEWYCAFLLIVTLIWLYVEILDILCSINKN